MPINRLQFLSLDTSRLISVAFQTTLAILSVMGASKDNSHPQFLQKESCATFMLLMISVTEHILSSRMVKSRVNQVRK